MPLRGEVSDFMKYFTALAQIGQKMRDSGIKQDYYRSMIGLRGAQLKQTAAHQSAMEGIAGGRLREAGRHNSAMEDIAGRRVGAAEAAEAGRQSRFETGEKGKNERADKTEAGRMERAKMRQKKGLLDDIPDEESPNAGVVGGKPSTPAPVAPGGAWAPTTTPKPFPTSALPVDQNTAAAAPVTPGSNQVAALPADDEDPDNEDDDKDDIEDKDEDDIDRENGDALPGRKTGSTRLAYDFDKHDDDTQSLADGGVVGGSGFGAGFASGVSTMSKAGKNNNNNSQNLAEGGEVKGVVSDIQPAETGTEPSQAEPVKDSTTTGDILKSWEGMGDKSPVHMGLMDIVDTFRKSNGAAAIPGASGGQPINPTSVLAGKAATDDEVALIDKSAIPPGVIRDSAKGIYRLNLAVNKLEQAGRSDDAAKVAGGLIAKAGLDAQKYGQYALQAYQRGDVGVANEMIRKAYDQVPDGRELRMSQEPDGTIHAKVIDPETGEEQDLGKFDRQQAMKFATGVANGSEFYKRMVEIGGRHAGLVPAKASAGGGAGNGRNVPSIKDLQESRQEVEGATADNADKQSIQFPEKHKQSMEGIAASLFNVPQNRQQGISPTQARQMANTLVSLKGDERPFGKPNADGSITYTDPTGRQFIVPHNAAMEALLVRSRLRGEQSAANEKQLGESEKQFMRQRQSDVDEARMAGARERSDQRERAEAVPDYFERDEQERLGQEHGRPHFLERVGKGMLDFDKWASERHPHTLPEMTDADVGNQMSAPYEKSMKDIGKTDFKKPRKAIEDDE